MPTFYNFRENGLDYSFDDIFVPAELFRDGNLWTWGSGFDGRLGNAQVTDILTPVTTFAGGSSWKQVSSGYAHTAAIKTDGTLWTWGANSAYGGLYASGRLGKASIADVSTPVTTFAGGTNWKQVSCGSLHTAAIKTDGTLWVWGANTFFSTYGSLGNATTTNVSTPVTTFAGGTNWKQVSCGQYYTAAIKTDGTLWVWGFGTSGQLGNASITSVSTPVTTFAGGSSWKQVSSGGYHTAAIKTDGTLWTWGSGFSGKLGNGETFSNVSTPVTTFAGGTNWKQVSSSEGSDNTAAIKTDGTLWVWGNGSNGRLGNGETTGNISTPVTTFAGGTNWKQVTCGGSHTAAIKTDGTLWTWGYSYNGRLGNATNAFTSISTPVTTFAGGTNWKQVSSGRFHTVATTYDDPVI